VRSSPDKLIITAFVHRIAEVVEEVGFSGEQVNLLVEDNDEEHGP